MPGETAPAVAQKQDRLQSAGRREGVETRLVRLIRELALRDMKLHALEVMPDHINLVIETDRRWAPAEFVGKIKATTSRVVRMEFPRLRPVSAGRRYFGHPTM